MTFPNFFGNDFDFLWGKVDFVINAQQKNNIEKTPQIPNKINYTNFLHNSINFPKSSNNDQKIN